MPDTLQTLPDSDREWSEEQWEQLIRILVESKLLTYREIASLTLGHLNPPQVGTSIASNKSFQSRFPKRQCWENVRKWFYQQGGCCVDCGTRLELQADHIIPKEELGDEANKLGNMTLRCRRCNVIKRPSHKNGGITYLTTEAALMWILFKKRPSSYQQYEKLCRDYGMTMANIRFKEAWAMARWLEKQGKYTIDQDSDL